MAKKSTSKTKKNTKIKNMKSRKKKKNRLILPLIALIIFIGLFAIKFSIRTYEEDKLSGELSSEQFIRIIEPYAKDEYKKSGILPSITLSQAILESNFGNSRLAREGKNLFGIKAGRSWKGDTIKFITEENHEEYITAYFRKYDSWEDSIDDHTKLLMQYRGYRENGLFNTKSYIKQAQALEDAGYATTKDSKGNKIYADKLIGVIKKYNLHKYDLEVLN